MDSIPRLIRLVPFLVFYAAFAVWFYNAVPSFFIHRLEDSPTTHFNPLMFCVSTDTQDYRTAKVVDTANSEIWRIFFTKSAKDVNQGGTIVNDCKIEDEFGNATFYLVVAAVVLIAGATILGGVFFPTETGRILSSRFLWVPLLIIGFAAFVVAAFIAMMVIATIYAFMVMFGILGFIALTTD